ncbi:AAA family ATPase [Methylorubrum rhodesianum]|uniref:AAA family ATPase n=1 Tax=Methylorubrum rhodesianum TaxID=29427 RepID=UPI003D067869
MRFTGFSIQNFKGIETAHLSLTPAGANVYTLIGLNESGKTTVLEAISTFDLYNDDTAPARLAVGETRPHPVSFVPKQLKSNFSGDVIITAHLELESGEKEAIIKDVEENFKAKVDVENVPTQFTMVRVFRFANSDYRRLLYSIGITLVAKKKGARKFESIASNDEIWKYFATIINNKIPQIVYFPTFLFNPPEKIELNPGESEQPINKLYREIIDNVAKSLPRPLDIQKHIVDRVINEENIAEKIISIILLAPDKQEQINASLNELSSHLSDTVFERWSKIFGGNFTGREIILRLGVSGESPDHKVHVDFSLKDRKSIYSISERSLSFRWFFSFLLFTIYRVSASGERSTLFLLDEPASNLHSAAQLQLIESFPKIATGNNQIIYSTHSHYMINPEWLDQAFIVSNHAIDYSDVNDERALTGKTHTNISIRKYREFVGSNPDKITYFQPVLDKLDVAPSKLDALRPAVILEGKGDYILIEYGRRVMIESSTSYSILPTRGATGMDELIGLHIAWGSKFAVCLDGDREGVKAAEKYKENWASIEKNIFTLIDISSELSGKGIEGFLAESDLKTISDHFSLKSRPSKGQIQLFFSEMLANKKKVELSDKFIGHVKDFDRKFSSILD